MNKLFFLLFFSISFNMYSDENKIILTNGNQIDEKVLQILEDECETQFNKKFRLSEIARIYFTTKKKNEKESTNVILMNQSILNGSVNLKEGEGVSVESEEFKFQFKMKEIKAVIFDEQPLKSNLLWETYLKKDLLTTDILFVKKEEQISTLEAIVADIDKSKIKVKWENDLKTLSLSRVAAILFANTENKFERNFEIYLSNLSKIICSHLTLKDQIVQFKLSESSPLLSLPIEAITKIEMINFQTISVSDLEPIDSQSEGVLLHFNSNWNKDFSLLKRPLKIAERTYEKGFGVHSYNRIKFKIPEGSVSFSTDFGIDSEFTNSYGCIFKILLDDKIILEKLIYGLDKATSFNYNLPMGSKEIVLIIEPGPMLDIGDYGVWGDPKFIKKNERGKK